MKIPNWWRPSSHPRARVSVTIGKHKASHMGLDALLDMDVRMTLPDGQTLSQEEWQSLVDSCENFVLIRGQWIEVDAQKLKETLSHWRAVKDQVNRDGISFSQAMRLLANAPQDTLNADSFQEKTPEWSQVVSGDWLLETRAHLRHPDAI